MKKAQSIEKWLEIKSKNNPEIRQKIEEMQLHSSINVKTAIKVAEILELEPEEIIWE